MAFLGPLDASWLFVESYETPMHVGGLQIFSMPAGAPPDFVGRLVTDFKSRTALTPPWNRKLSGSLLDRVLPSWTMDDKLDLDYHVRHSGLPRPGGERELGVLISRLHSQRLDLTRPLWECHFVEGLKGRRFAVYTKMHHSMIDGVSGMRLLQRSLSTDPATREMSPPWSIAQAAPPEGVPASGEQAPTADLIGTVADIALKQAGAAAEVSVALLRLLAASLSPDDALVAPLTGGWSVINGRVGAPRRFATQSMALSDVKAVAKAAGCTLNDVVLAICSGALRRFLKESDRLPAHALIAGLPVNVRPAGNEETGTAISFICANLATDLEDPRARIAVIKASTDEAKKHLQTLSPAALTQYTIAIMAPHILQVLTGLGGKLRPVFNLTISNVQGPDKHLYLNGARMEAMYPLSVLSHGQALNITCLSYAGRLHFGFTGCRDTLPHMQRLAVYSGEEIELLKSTFA